MANYNLTQTGAQVQVLLDTVAAGYVFMGTATPTTTPDTTNPNVCYLATTAGTYTNFSSLTLATGYIAILCWDGTNWTKHESAINVVTDATPVQYSTEPIQSNALWNNALDISKVSNKTLHETFFATNKGSLLTGTNAAWYQPEYRTHFVIPCTKGDKFIINAHSTTATQFQYGWMTSSYTPPTTNSTIPYVSGTTRVLANVETNVELIAPEGAAYICLVTKDGGNNILTYDINIYPNLPLNNNVATLHDKDKENEYARSVIGYRNNLSLPAFINSYIATNGTTGSSTSVMCFSDFIEVIGDMANITVNYDVLKSIITDLSYVKINVHCYDANKSNLGRTSQNYQSVLTDYTPQWIYLTGTKYIKISYSAKQNGVSGDMTISTYLDSINASRNDIFTITDTIKGKANIILNFPYNLFTHPKKGKFSIYTHYGLQAASSAASSAQSYGNYGGYLFQVIPNGTIKLYELSQGEATYVRTLSYTSSTHGNASQFYPSSVTSGFPYLYVAGENYIEVLSVSTTSVSVVQTITLNLSGTSGSYSKAWGIAGDDGYIWVSRAMYGSGVNKMKFEKFSLPTISEGNITLSDSDVIDSWELANVNHNNYVNQGMKVYNGKLYQVYGGTDGNRGIWVFDTRSHNLICNIDLNKYLNVELEDIIFDNDNMYLFVVSATYFHEIAL